MRKFAIVSEGVVVELLDEFIMLTETAEDGTEISRQVPLEERYSPEYLASMVEAPEGVLEGWLYDGQAFTAPPAAPAPTAEQVLAQRDSLLAQATLRIAPLQDAVDLGEATAEETASLTAWKQYRVLLNRITTQPGFPVNVTWPQQPQ